MSSSLPADMFQPFKIPFVFSHQTSDDPIDGQHNRFQSRYLGVCRMEYRSIIFPYCTFYELTESEISEISSSKEEMMDESPALPPKKRKKVMRYDLIFSVDPASSQLSFDQQMLYIFPREAMSECLTESAPHKVTNSLHIKENNYIIHVIDTLFLLPRKFCTRK